MEGELRLPIGNYFEAILNQEALGKARRNPQNGYLHIRHSKEYPPSTTTEPKHPVARCGDAVDPTSVWGASEDLDRLGHKLYPPLTPQPIDLLLRLGSKENSVARRLLQLVCNLLQPSLSLIRERIHLTYVGFDVEYRCLIKEVGIPNYDPMPLDRDQGHSGYADRAWTVRRASRKHTPTLRWTARRCNEGPPIRIPIEPPDKPYSLEAREILQALLQTSPWIQLDDVLFVHPIARLMRRVEFHHLGGVNDSYGLTNELHQRADSRTDYEARLA